MRPAFGITLMVLIAGIISFAGTLRVLQRGGAPGETGSEDGSLAGPELAFAMCVFTPDGHNLGFATAELLAQANELWSSAPARPDGLVHVTGPCSSAAGGNPGAPRPSGR